MRKFKNFMLLIMTVSLVTLTGCSSDDEGDNGVNTAPSGVLVAKIDGASYQSMEISSSATVANNGQNLVIIATNSEGKAFSFTVFGYEGAGTYQIGGGSNITNTASYTETDVSNPQNPSTEIWQAPYDDTQAGSLTITEETDSKVKGTFSVKCKNVNGDNSIKDITEGSFDLNKQTI